MHRHGPIEVADYHVAGAPFRVVASGIPRLEGDSALERVEYALAHGDDLRKLIVNAPRGHAGLRGGFVTPPVDSGVDLGLVFFDRTGYSPVSATGTIALITWAIESGRLPTDGSRARVVAETPAGRVTATANIKDGRVESVSFTNVPSYIAARYIPVQLADGVVSVDVAYGGAYFASVDTGELGVPLHSDNLRRLEDLGLEIGAILGDNPAVVHPTDHRLSGLAGTTFYENLDGPEPGRHERSVTVTTGGTVLRSPCGGATSARLALLDSSADLPRGERLIHESTLGGRFTGTVVDDGEVGGVHGVVTEVQGRAHPIGAGSLWLEADDPLAYGYQMR